MGSFVIFYEWTFNKAAIYLIKFIRWLGNNISKHSVLILTIKEFLEQCIKHSHVFISLKALLNIRSDFTHWKFSICELICKFIENRMNRPCLSYFRILVKTFRSILWRQKSIKYRMKQANNEKKIFPIMMSEPDNLVLWRKPKIF